MPGHLHNDFNAATQVNPQFYAFRWITLLLTQEFSFPDVVRLWVRHHRIHEPAGPSLSPLQAFLCSRQPAMWPCHMRVAEPAAHVNVLSRMSLTRNPYCALQIYVQFGDRTRC